jgi:hypothetical protein
MMLWRSRSEAAAVRGSRRAGSRLNGFRVETRALYLFSRLTLISGTSAPGVTIDTD